MCKLMSPRNVFPFAVGVRYRDQGDLNDLTCYELAKVLCEVRLPDNPVGYKWWAHRLEFDDESLEVLGS